MATTPRHWDRRGQHQPAGQSSSSHNLYTENWTQSTPLPPPQTKNIPFRWMSMQHRSSNSQPHPAVLPHLGRFETPNMAQSSGCPQEALGTGWDTVADCRLHLTHQTEDLVWPGMQQKKKKNLFDGSSTWIAPKHIYRDTINPQPKQCELLTTPITCKLTRQTRYPHTVSL